MKKRLLTILSLIGLTSVLGASVYTFYNLRSTSHNTNGHAASLPSPLIWGTNLTIDTPNDPFLTNPAVRATLKAEHVQFIRMPFRTNSPSQPTPIPESVNIQMMQDVQNMGGITPEIVIHTVAPGNAIADPTALQDDIMVLNDASKIFTGPIYVDFGNEDDGTWAGTYGWSEAQYTSMWNTYLPQIKAGLTNASQFKFGGPVNFQGNPAYVSAFAKAANPAPDYIVWHTYTTPAGWGTAIDSTRTQLGSLSSLPFIMDEWNYNANTTASDGKCNVQSYIGPYTQSAIQLFINKGVYAAAQYSAIGLCPLVDSTGNATLQGLAFKASYESVFGTSNTTVTASATTTATPTPTVTTTDTSTPTPTDSTTVTATPTVTDTPTATVVSTSTLTPTPTDSTAPATTTAAPTTSVSTTATTAVVSSMDANGTPTNNGTFNITTSPLFKGTGTVGDTITITIHSDPITQTTTVGSDGTWSIQFTNIPAGEHSVLIADSGPGGNTTIANYTVTASTSGLPNTASPWTLLITLVFGSIVATIGGKVLLIKKQAHA